MKRKLLVAVGALIFINGAVLCFVSNLNFGVFFTLALGAALLGIGIFNEKIQAYSKKRIFRVLKSFCVAGVCLMVFLSMFLAFYGVSDTCTYREDAVIVLGTSVNGDKVSETLKHRLDKATEYHAKNPEALIVVTGGKGPQEDVTEAYAMEKYLIEKGVNPDKIIKEEKATSTSENMKFSKELLDDFLGENYSVAVITNAFHIYRGVDFAQRTGFKNVTNLHADLNWYSVLPCYLRECFAVFKMWGLGY